MGIDVKGLYAVVHYGAPEGTDDYLQETGRAGRQGEESVAVLLHHPKAFTIRKPSKAMKDYVGGSACRRKTLLDTFTCSSSGDEAAHTFTCCDICDKDRPSWVEAAIKYSNNSAVTRVLSDEEKVMLKDRFATYRQGLLQNLPSEGLVAGPDLATGFPDKLCQQVIEGAETVMSFDEFWDKYPFCDRLQAREVYDILEEVVGDCCQIETVQPSSVSNFDEEFDETESEDEYQEIILESDEDEEWY